MNNKVGFYFNKDADMVEKIFNKCFKYKFFKRRTAINIKFSVILRLNDLRIEDNRQIENLSFSEISTQIYNMLEEEINNLKKFKEKK